MPAKFWTRICVHDPRSVTGPFTCAMVLWECFRWMAWSNGTGDKKAKTAFFANYRPAVVRYNFVAEIEHALTQKMWRLAGVVRMRDALVISKLGSNFWLHITGWHHCRSAALRCAKRYLFNFTCHKSNKSRNNLAYLRDCCFHLPSPLLLLTRPHHADWELKEGKVCLCWHIGHGRGCKRNAKYCLWLCEAKGHLDILARARRHSTLHTQQGLRIFQTCDVSKFSH